jgi:phosphoribosylanthranilate isomerase
MALKTKVLVENITNLSEARYCAGMGVHLLAFPVQSVDPKLYQEITSWVSGPEMVLDLSGSIELPSTINEYKCDHILMRLDQLQLLDAQLTTHVIVRLKTNQDLSYLIRQRDQISYLLADGLSETDIKNYSNNFRVLVLDRGETDLYELLQLPVKGIVLSGNNEAKPGLKDYDHLSFVLEKLEVSED